MAYPNTFYHVLSRGNERSDIFRDKRDYEVFTDTIRRMVERYNLEVHAYVLMGNHYHLLVRTLNANLSRAIQWLGLTYATRFNRRHARTGHLFHGRFKSFVIENESYYTRMCLYIHRNPVRAGLVENLLDYPWSSYLTYAGVRRKEPWLTTSLVLGIYGGSRKKFIEAQLAYAGKEKTLLDKLRYGLFLGSDRFVEESKKLLGKERHTEKPQVRAALKDQDISVVVNQVFSTLGVEDPTQLLKPIRRQKRLNRDLAIYILCHVGVFRHREVGRVFGVGYTSITGALKRAQSYVDSDKKIGRKVARALNDI
jgi:putative transposase